MVTTSGRQLLDVAKLREDFPILSKTVYGKPLVYLDNAATSQKPRSVIRALSEYYEGYNSNVHRGVHALSMEATERFEEARQKIAAFIKADTTESIIWTRNTTESINLVAGTWAQSHINAGDEIVLTQMGASQQPGPLAEGSQREGSHSEVPAPGSRWHPGPARCGHHHQPPDQASIRSP